MRLQKRIAMLSLLLMVTIGLVCAHSTSKSKEVIAAEEPELQEEIENESSEEDSTASEEEPPEDIVIEEDATEEDAAEENNVSDIALVDESGQEQPGDILTGEDAAPADGLKNFLSGGVVLSAESEAVVYTFDEYKAALESSTVTTIYIGENIVMEAGGAIVNPNKNYLIIDGINPDDPSKTVHSMTDYNSISLADTVRLNTNTGPKSVTMRNLLIYGRNFYGPIAMYDAAKGVSMAFENIEYYGPRLIFNHYGTVHFKNTWLEMGTFGGASPLRGVGEVAGLSFEGNVTIKQVEATANEIFYFNTQAGDIEVKSGAVVDVSTYSDAGFINALYDVTFTAQPGAEFYYTGPQRFWEASGCFSNFTVNKGAKVHINITGTKASSVLQVLGLLYVGEGAELHLTSGSGSYAALSMSANAMFDNPGSVLLSSPAYRAIIHSSNGAIDIGAQQLNYWTAAGSGGFNNRPLYTWRKADESIFTLDGILSAGTAGNFTWINTNFNSEDTSAAEAPNKNNFSMTNARVISFGRLEVDAEYEYLSETAARVIGSTTPAAEVLLSYADEGGNAVTYSVTADAAGEFLVNLPGPLPDNTAITIQCHYQYLFAERTISSAKNILQFQSVPHLMAFPSSALKAKAEIIGREMNDWKIEVYNSLGTGSRWKLTARLITADENESVLEGAFVFIGENGNAIVLDTFTETLILQHTAAADIEITAVNWDADRGILLYLKPGVALADVKYTGTIRWTLANAP